MPLPPLPSLLASPSLPCRWPFHPPDLRVHAWASRRVRIAGCALALLGLGGCTDDASHDARHTGRGDATVRHASDDDAGESNAQRPATAAAATTAGAGWGDGYALVVAGGGWHLVLDPLSHGSPPAHGTPRLANRESYVVHASIPDADLSDAARAWSRGTVEVVTDRGARCAARVGAFEYRVDLVPDDEAALLWPGHDLQARERPPALRGAALAARVWDAAYSRKVTARLALLEPNACEGEPLYARRSASADGRVATARAEVPRRAEVLSAFRALPAYATAQASYERLVTGDDADATRPVLQSALRWEYVDREPRLQAFGLPGEASALVSVSVPSYGCDDAIGPLWAVFRVGPAAGGAIELVHLSDMHAPLELRLLLESGAGRYDFVAGSAAMGELSVIRDEDTLASYTAEFHGCGC